MLEAKTSPQRRVISTLRRGGGQGRVVARCPPNYVCVGVAIVLLKGKEQEKEEEEEEKENTMNGKTMTKITTMTTK